MVSKFIKKDNLLICYLNFSYQKIFVGGESEIGNQIEFCWCYQLLFKFCFEFGGVYMVKGDVFVQGDYLDDIVYGYIVFLFKFQGSCFIVVECGNSLVYINENIGLFR